MKLDLLRIFYFSIAALFFSVLPCCGPCCAEVTGNGIIFQTDFESQNFNCWDTRGTDGWNISGCGGLSSIGKGSSVALVQNEIFHSGSKSMRVRFSSDEQIGGADATFSDQNHIFTRFYDYYHTNFDFGFGMKIQRIRSFNPVSAINNFDMVLVSWGSPTSGSYDFSGTNGMQAISLNYNGGPVEWTPADANFGFQRSRWYCVETEVKLNDPGSSNGLVKIWVDGNLIAQKSNLNIRGNLSAGLNNVMFGGWYSNGAAGRNPQPNPSPVSNRFVDDIAVGTERIGCESGGGGSGGDGSNQPPSTPGGLRFTN